MDNFLARYPAGSKIDTDGFPADQPFQCYDAFMVYLRILSGDPNLYIVCRSSGYVKDFWNDYGSNGIEKYFDRIPWDSAGQKGDVIIWGNAPATPYSHVAMLLEDKGTKQYVYGQNQPHPYTTIIDFTSNGMLGYLRPKQGGNVETIKSMYWRLLGREADQGGIITYTEAAQTKGMEYVYNTLKNSPEGQADWAWRNPDAVRALEQRVTDATKTSSQAAKDLTVVRAELTTANGELAKTKDDLALTVSQRDILQTTIQSQEQTILQLQKQIDEQRDDGGIKPTPPVDYSWVLKLQDWLRGIFHK